MAFRTSHRYDRAMPDPTTSELFKAKTVTDDEVNVVVGMFAATDDKGQK
ncbi:hypothetical protein AFCDBAGC_5149 [Methylobacterium cerastii]|uniref:Uncharacterized protein n=1 Tax=Methylobacterium cerastii TaxID=932741 RepID=A0ABQ4QRC3_9HYPH|nr:hypothetical protein [Methylobacterium cerastii]GJD47256.1 hypothetical protein AFCDBAGC_5149 [Methylobacterium cerastii]